MGEMLELMDGMEIRANHGSFHVVGPNVYQPADENGQRTYRVVFVRRRTPTHEPAPGSQNQPGILHNGNLRPEEDDGVPLLNRLDLIDGVPVIIEENVIPNGIEQNGFANGDPHGNDPDELNDPDQPEH